VDEWVAVSMARALKMGVMQGSAGKMEPFSNITREQAFVILARALKLEPAVYADKDFEDADEVSNWAKGHINALVNAGYLQGSGGKLNPKSNISRAEFAQVMHNTIKQYIKAGGEYAEVADGNIMVNVPGVILRNVTINGDLIVGDGVGDGDLILNNVTIEGRLVVRGGGLNSIIIIGGSVEGKVVIAKLDGNIRVSVEGGADVEVIVIDDGRDDVIIEGTVGTVEINAPDVPVTIQNATVDNVVVNCESAADITVASNAQVSYLAIGDSADGTTVNVRGQVANIVTFAAGTAISGTGAVGTVTAGAGADNTSVTTPNTVVNSNGASGVTAGGGKSVPANGSATNNSSGIDIVTPGTSDTPPSDNNGGSNLPPSPPLPNYPIYYAIIRDVSVDGEAVVGSTLTADTDPVVATVRYQWMRANTENGTYTNIYGATSRTYTLKATDAGKYIKVKVTGYGYYAGTVQSDPVRPVVDNTIPVVRGSLERDPGNTGGDDLVYRYGSTPDTIVFESGEIKWYPADETLGRAAGNRGGVQISAPAEFDTSATTVTIGENTYNWNQNEIDDGDCG
jgi:hypothetical protein